MCSRTRDQVPAQRPPNNRSNFTVTSKIGREVAWLAGCVLAATAFCWYAPEYGYSPVPFLAVAFYVLTGVIRFAVTFLRKQSS
jgi:hypothetical protein